MTAIFLAQKNSNVFEYVKARVLNNDLDYLLEKGVSELLAKLSDQIDIEHLIIWQDGSLEVSVYSDFYEKHDKSIFKNSVTNRDDIKGFNKHSTFYRKNKDIFELIEKKVKEITAPFQKGLSKKIFGCTEKGSSNVEKYYYFNDSAYVAIKNISLIPDETKQLLVEINLSDFYFEYKKAKETA